MKFFFDVGATPHCQLMWFKSPSSPIFLQKMLYLLQLVGDFVPHILVGDIENGRLWAHWGTSGPPSRPSILDPSASKICLRPPPLAFVQQVPQLWQWQRYTRARQVK